MKKSIILLAAAFAIVGCAKNTGAELTKDAEMAIAPFARINTSKALVTGTEFPKTEDINAFGYFSSSCKAGTAVSKAFDVPYIYDKVFACDQTGVWRGKGKTYYWPKTGSIVFAGYHGNANVDYVPGDTQVMNIKDYSNTDYTITGTDMGYGQDLLYFPVTDISYDKVNGINGVPVVLHHALTWITFQAVCNETADGQFRIDSVFVNKVLRDGDAVITGTQSAHTCVWTAKAPELKITQFKGTGSAEPSEKDNYVVRCNGGKAGKFGIEFSVVPQKATSVTICYSQLAEGVGNSGQWIKMAPVEVDMTQLVEVGKTIKLTNWQPATHYTYTLSFSLDPKTDEITIKPVVADWTDVEVEPVNI